MIESSLFSDLVFLSDSNVSRFSQMIDPALQKSLLILLVSLALMLLPVVVQVETVDDTHHHKMIESLQQVLHLLLYILQDGEPVI